MSPQLVCCDLPDVFWAVNCFAASLLRKTERSCHEAESNRGIFEPCLTCFHLQKTLMFIPIGFMMGIIGHDVFFWFFSLTQLAAGHFLRAVLFLFLFFSCFPFFASPVMCLPLAKRRFALQAPRDSQRQAQRFPGPTRQSDAPKQGAFCLELAERCGAFGRRFDLAGFGPMAEAEEEPDATGLVGWD